MKDAVKLFGILFFGLLTAVIIYPFLHESGHLIAAVLLGAEVLEFNLFPLPNILCNMANMSIVEKIIIGLNGLFLPIFFYADTVYVSQQRYNNSNPHNIFNNILDNKNST